MKSFIAASVALFAASVSAAPYTPTTIVQFTNDFSGRNANVAVPLAGSQSVATLLDNTPIDVDGAFLATSFFLQSNFQGVQCVLSDAAFAPITINTQKTFAHIASPPVNLVAAQIACSYV